MYNAAEDAVKQTTIAQNIKMASKKVFDLMKAEVWNEVMELLTSIAWTSHDLDEKHGVRSIELFLLLIIQN